MDKTKGKNVKTATGDNINCKDEPNTEKGTNERSAGSRWSCLFACKHPVSAGWGSFMFSAL